MKRSKFKPTTRPTAVIGGGTLGSRIALMLASSGGEVRLYDAKPAQLEIAERYVGTLSVRRVIRSKFPERATPFTFPTLKKLLL